MSIVLGLLALVAFAYLLYHEFSKPKAKGTGGGGVKPDDHINPDKK
jgi:hypothetical protein